MKNTLADAFDRFATSLALFLLLWSTSLAMKASAHLVDERLGSYLTDWVIVPHALGFLALLLAAIIYIRQRGPINRDNAVRSFPDSYVTEASGRSAVVAFIVTVMLVAVLDSRADQIDLPAGFFIELLGCASLAAFSVTFFFLNRRSAKDEGNEQETSRE